MKSALCFILCLVPSLLQAQGIVTIAGTGTIGYSGDGGQATNARILPSAVCTGQQGDIYFADASNNVVRKIATSGIVTTVAGNGSSGFSGDGGPATNAQFNLCQNVILDDTGNIYISDLYNNRVRKVSVAGIVTTIAGTGTAGYNGDGGQATAARIAGPQGMAFDKYGNFYFAESGSVGIRKIAPSGIITTVAGHGASGYAGDGGQATAAIFHNILGIWIDSNDVIYLADKENYRIRKIMPDGIVTTYAGTGHTGSVTNGGSALSSSFMPWGVIGDKFGNIFFSNYLDNSVYRISKEGNIYRVAGSTSAGFSGDGGPATAAQLNHPFFLCLDDCGNIYIPDGGNYRIRKVSYSKCNYLAEEELRKQDELNIYPNPVRDVLHIENASAIEWIDVVDVLGRNVLQTYPPSERTTTICLEHLSPGLYMIKVNGAFVQRVVKE
jgi:hypothetical protein